MVQIYPWMPCPQLKQVCGHLLGRAGHPKPPLVLLSRALLWENSSPGRRGVWAGKEGDVFAVAQKARAFLWIRGLWVLIAACFDHLSPKLLWMCLRANKQV